MSRQSLLKADELCCVAAPTTIAAPTTTVCGTDTDPNNCGTCGNMCPPTYICSSGGCVAPNVMVGGTGGAPSNSPPLTCPTGQTLVSVVLTGAQFFSDANPPNTANCVGPTVGGLCSGGAMFSFNAGGSNDPFPGNGHNFNVDFVESTLTLSQVTCCYGTPIVAGPMTSCPGAEPVVLACPSGTQPIGLSGRAGAALNQLDLVCG